ncbi:Phosphoglucosamine mutase [Methanosalsum zhilinae DSM 4017]|uniref:Phosphoglucosamine mutase n=1 Tax=Methanosalsum zhilinae (strain DSM 4017 / NBRC 107636 / OCM 62 / WeN5) TaxID=679901 RepID=F7XPX0_METZD|nr:phosphoglucosamine mutase [Methanosalsum zhilinae]AEH61491.1 Phosphoglucosamine mutase [Methanosalsum zhilinae DSM 4017]
MKLFGSSGIRGIANEEVTVDLALKVGMTLGNRNTTAVIGRDPRISGEMIENSIISGLASAGCEVYRTGVVTTPTLAYAARKFDCGVMVTASHNPAEYIGIKLWNPDGMAFDSKQQNEIESDIKNSNLKQVGWNSIGQVTDLPNVIRSHSDIILKNAGVSQRKIVVDPGCGPGGLITPHILRKMGCEVITINSQIDGTFPARNPEPSDKNLHLLKTAVKQFNADAGIAHDGDADRMMVVDDNGDFVPGDELLAIFGQNECNKGDTIAVPVDTSMTVDDALESINIIRTRVGDVYVAEAIKKYRAVFGGEPSGSWIFPKLTYCPDGIYAAAKIVTLINDSKLSEIRRSLPRYPIIRNTFECSNGKKEHTMNLIKKKAEPLGQVSQIDGIRIDMDSGWLLIRPSGTEPKIRITAQSRNNVKEIYSLGEEIVKEALL